MHVSPMRTLAPLVVLAALAPLAAAQGTYEHTVYLHENPLHALPERINANLGDTLKLTIENPESGDPERPKSPHNLVVCADAPSPSNDCTNVWGRSAMIQPGTSAPLTFVVDQPGTFQYWCTIAGHKGGGMVGTLIVQGSEAEVGLPGFTPVYALAACVAMALILRRAAK